MDPDAKDPIALDTTSDIMIEPISDLPELPDLGLGDINTPGLQVSGMGLRSTPSDMTNRATAAALSSFDSDFASSSSGSSDSGSDSDDDDNHGGKDNSSNSKTGEVGVATATTTAPASTHVKPPRRRPSTTEAKHRISLDDDDLDLSFTLDASTLSVDHDSPETGPEFYHGRGSDDVRQQGQHRQGQRAAGRGSRGGGGGETQSPFADPIEFSEGSSSSEDSEGDVVEIKPRRSF